MAVIRVTCGRCGAVNECDETLFERSLSCGQCGQPIIVEAIPELAELRRQHEARKAAAREEARRRAQQEMEEREARRKQEAFEREMRRLAEERAEEARLAAVRRAAGGVNLKAIQQEAAAKEQVARETDGSAAWKGVAVSQAPDYAGISFIAVVYMIFGGLALLVGVIAFVGAMDKGSDAFGAGLMVLFGSVVAGLLLIGTGQVFSAFRDIAINSFRMAESLERANVQRAMARDE